MKFRLVVIVILLTSSALSASATHIWPQSGTNDTLINAHIFGSNFNSSTSPLKLVRSGNPEINATNITVVNDNYLTCDFNLNGSITGIYDLVINLDTLKMCYTINERITQPYFFATSTVNNCHKSLSAVAVGDGNNDGEMEIYGCTGCGKIYQCKYNGTSWDTTIVGSVVSWINDIKVGDGNNDGELEVYIAYTDSVFQYKWNGSSWDSTSIGIGCKKMAIGDGNNDGMQEVYCVRDSIIYQHKYVSNSWHIMNIGPGYYPLLSIAIGDGNNDGELEVYGGGGGYMQNGYLYQYKWVVNHWERTTVVYHYQMGVSNIVVCDGNKDGEFEVYESYYRFLAQHKWDGSTWNSTPFATNINNQIYELTCGDGNNDGEIEIYAAYDNYSVYQHKFNGSSWDYIIIGTLPDWIEGLAVGDGNNNGLIEIYAGCRDSMIYQFRTALSQNILLYDTFHDFGNIPPGDSGYWQYLVLENTGEKQLIIDSVISTNNVYSLDIFHWFPDTILPNNILPLEVYFHPLVQYHYPGTLKVYSDDPDEPLRLVYLEGLCDITPPVIESTTIVNDTTYPGPYLINAKITDNLILDTALLFYKRTEDAVWDSTELTCSSDNWYTGEIPQVTLNPDTVKYYIYARDRGLNESTDPDSAPSLYYSFICTSLGIEEELTKNSQFSCAFTTPAREQITFHITLPLTGDISLTIYDISGRQLSNLIPRQSFTSGDHLLTYKPEKPGLYFYILEAANLTDMGKFLIVD
ncbi:MAG: hypothetical protein APR63_14435 [Desulfuromonas sp. SDB]|nr:MAG: hypothetical protein APR63_14435 [Desulfuromonas sp. SDB]